MSTILIAGGSGLLGMRLSHLLHEKGHKVLHLSRRADSGATFPTFAWDPKNDIIDTVALRHCDFIINLAGAGIADGPWSDSRKELLISSRVNSVRLLKRKISDGAAPKLKAYISASAIGFYGNRGEVLLRETNEAGKTGFLPEIVNTWENTIEEVASTRTRTVALRIGIVLSDKDGALKKMMIPFRLFAATYFGNGLQWYSWIHIDDLCRIFMFAMENEISGTFNAVAPNPERNKDLILKLKTALGKPAIILPVPEFALRATMGELADVVLDSTKVSSEKIQDAGFNFHFPELLPALQDILRRKI